MPYISDLKNSNARVAELVDAPDSKSGGHCGRASSSLASGTKKLRLDSSGKHPIIASAYSEAPFRFL